MNSGFLTFWEENGSYIAFQRLAHLPGQYLRNRMLAAKFGVRKIEIGPGSHLRGLAHISMGEDFASGQGLWLEAVTRYGDQRFNPRLVIGARVRISQWTHIACTCSIQIGNDVLIGSKVLIADHNHGNFSAFDGQPTIPPAQRPLNGDRSVIIGSNVWLGDGVVVCPGVTVGEGSVAGANAVITTDIPQNTLVAGVPARAIRRYDPSVGVWVRV